MPAANEDNEAIFETLREGRSLLDRRYDKLLDIWLAILQKKRHTPLESQEVDDATVKRLSHLKELSKSLLERCNMVGLAPRGRKAASDIQGKNLALNENEDDDDFEDVPDDETVGDFPPEFMNDDQKELSPPASLSGPTLLPTLPKEQKREKREESSSRLESSTSVDFSEEDLTHEGNTASSFLFLAIG